ncbi:MAG: hypothetical protein ABI465_05970 [Ktedonobacteraceae bacterium]
MQLSTSRTFSFLTYLRRLVVLIFGLFLCSVGIVCTYRSAMGLGPWDVLHQGISRHTPLSFGQASIVVGGLLILGGLLIKVRPGIGTVLNMLLIGIFVDAQLRSNWLPDLSASPLAVRLLLDAGGVLLMGIGTAFYITPRLGAGPRDGLMMRLHVLTHVRIAFVRAAIECSALVIGFFLGGTTGLGTLLFAFGVGPAVEIGFWLTKKLAFIVGPPPVTAVVLDKQTLASDPVPPHQVSHPVDQHSS